MTKYFNHFIFLSAILFSHNYCHAQDVITLVSHQGADLKGVMPLPQQGELSSTVKAHWGQPISISKSVGSPPISKLEYADFLVYLEGNHVLHAVIKHK